MQHSKRMLIGGLLIVCLMTSCGESDSPSGTGGQTETAGGELPPEADRCPGGETSPLKVEHVVEAGLQKGIRLYDDPQCVPVPHVRRQAANIVLHGPHTNVRDQEEIEARDG